MDLTTVVLKLDHANATVGILALFGATILTIGLFLLVPITQAIDAPNFEKKIIEMPAPIHLPPPSPPPKSLPKVEKIKETSTQKPKLEQSKASAQIKGLDFDFTVGMGVELGISGGFGNFETEIDVVQQVKELFTFDDLSAPPRYISIPRLIFPKELIRRGIKEGKVVMLIEIDETGKAKVLEIISSTHPRLEPEAIRIVRKAKFTLPIINGIPTKVQGEWPLLLKAP